MTAVVNPIVWNNRVMVVEMTSFGGGARKQLNCADNGGGQGWGGGTPLQKWQGCL